MWVSSCDNNDVCIETHGLRDACKTDERFSAHNKYKKWLFFISKQILAFKQSGGMCSL